MTFVIVLALGVFLQFVVPGSPLVSALVGAAAGIAATVVSVRWPRARPAYVDPTVRPNPVRFSGQAGIAAIIFAVGVGFALFLMANPFPRLPLSWTYGFYLAGIGVGTSIGILLTAKRSREAHNNWLASMVAKPSLDTDQ